MGFEPSYLRLHSQGLLKDRAAKALALLESCRLCPRACGANRLKGELGFCETGRKAAVASASAHFGEETPLVGRSGSGTIFISSCNLLCSFCQNHEISHGKEGVEVEPEHMGALMLELSRAGCHNINFVTPTHVVPQILEALPYAIERGLSVPLVYNSGGYDRVETLEILNGVFDLYMPDFKFWDNRWAERYCQAPDYREVAMAALREMHRQVGDLVLDERGIAQRGLLVRHLVMPNRVAGTEEIMTFLAKEISPNTYVNVMDQYRPCGSGSRDEFIGRRLDSKEYREAVKAALGAGMERLDERDRIRLIFRP
ncbi:MAG: radical SAM protein [Desulfobacterota bacterium]|nr:radical SAM protein [Thermodesulfobacteriota bacterium]